ncbi:DNA-binding domain-containing protein [Candidatus Berkiella cookevillensis]|uniref:DNA-binding domain-containing protein n=1 Tax=Candidatus Berkiella cookevillensis TaxID=437022 RepID=A0A0Q9YLD0_9GAMM|nr:DNA-binding domain-containing protein [Candidatus Berkiella cookevillensis]MCS5709526.1 DNA-binding domain-containing protein [Candidatus Berkiella cookevillensis]
MELNELQAAFLSEVREAKSDDALKAHVKNRGCLSWQQRIAIYRDSFKGNLIACLKAAYPVCLRLVGEEYFSALALRYIAIYEHRQPSLVCYGDQFADFLAHFEPVQRVLPYLSDVARLEWAYHLALDSPEYDTLNCRALSQVSDAEHMRLIFMLPPASTLLYSDFPIYMIWKMNQPESTLQSEISLASEPQLLFVFRYDWHVYIEHLSTNEFEMLTQIQQGRCFADICEYLLQKDSAIDMNAIFATCVGRKWLTGFRLSP